MVDDISDEDELAGLREKRAGGSEESGECSCRIPWYGQRGD
ncbi:hypothetical protein [Methanogenium cariaci]|nr:hypothetical protein [Methanogenium cariaci]